MMKKCFLLLALGTTLTVAANAQKNSPAIQELDSLMKSQPLDTAKVLQGLKQLTKSSKEKDWMEASRFYYRLGKTGVVDSLQEAELKQFPLGYIARSNGAKEVFDAQDPEASEKVYNQWIAKFPPEKFPSEDHDRVVYDYVTAAIAKRYAEAGNADKAKFFIDKLMEEFWKGNGYGSIAETFYKKGDLANAEIYTKKAMESSRLFLNATDNAGKFAASGYPGLTRTYAKILFEEHKYDEALQYIDTVYQMNQQIDPATNYTYAKLLLHAGRNQDAYDKLEEVIKTGKATPQIDSTFRELYLGSHGDAAAYTAYMDKIKKVVLENLRKELTGQIMDKPAPGFTLRDVNGKEVSLSQFAGKTVVVDFWATWCGPCKRSFPAMQKAVNKYRNDKNVQFLFIHTWERDDKATDEAKAYVQDNHYNFEVLMDLKDPASKQNKVVSSYGVQGIPAKFVIDPKGHIRFQLTGFDGSDEQAVNEISMMIEMARANNG